MKKLILQHWGGELNELAEKSVAQFQTYAEWVGADYELLRDHAFSSVMPKTSPTQKVAMIKREWDDYDVVVMVDPDMFLRGRIEHRADIFEEETGIGYSGDIQARLKQSMGNQFPLQFDPRAPWYGGACWRLDRDYRQAMQACVHPHEFAFFSTRKTHGDEGYMHRLATLAGIRKTNAFSTARWQWPSHWDGVETESEFIHIRPKMIENGKEVRVPKEEAYRSLVEKGIILE